MIAWCVFLVLVSLVVFDVFVFGLFDGWMGSISGGG